MKSADLTSVDAAIAKERIRLDRWLETVYGTQHPREYVGELDCGYEDWGALESTAGHIFDNRLTQSLSQSSLDSLLFFISRNEEAACIIAWQGLVGPLSGVGNLTMSDFLYLCEASLSRPEDYSDYELVACFRKIDEFDASHASLVERFFDRTYAYTKRTAIEVLAATGYDGIPRLAEQLWSHDDCEFTKLSCLYALKAVSNGEPQFKQFLADFKDMYDVDASEYLPAHIERLES